MAKPEDRMILVGGGGTPSATHGILLPALAAHIIGGGSGFKDELRGLGLVLGLGLLLLVFVYLGKKRRRGRK